MRNRSDVCIIVPAYNEAAAIHDVLFKLARLPYHVIVVDDGSADDTSRRALTHPVTVLRHTCNLGQGAALQTGITYSLRLPETRFIVTFDSDGQHAAVDVDRLLAPLRAGTHDVVLGSRFLKDGGAVNIPRLKRLLLHCAVWFTRLTSGLSVTDTHNGLRALTAEAARKLNITHNRMAHASELLSQFARLRVRYCEVPVTVTYTPYSMSKGQAMLNAVNILWDMTVARMR
jgi:glycosyltransferase involved in cell wall biosynthesis